MHYKITFITFAENNNKMNKLSFSEDSLKMIYEKSYSLSESKGKTRQKTINYVVIESLQKKAAESKIPYNILEAVYYRGIADHASGHRPTITSQQWAFNRVNSFINEGAAYNNADRDLAEGVMALRASQKAALNLIKKDKKVVDEDYGAGFEGTSELLKKLKKDTPGESVVEKKKTTGFKNYMYGDSNE